MKCRHCSSNLKIPFIDLGFAPPSNAYLTKEALDVPEKWFPLRVKVCENCWLVQTEDFAQSEELFSPDYAYFSSFSISWLQHVQAYVEVMRKRFCLNDSSYVVEIGANDGYLLQFIKDSGIPCMGVEPTASTAAAAQAKGIAIIEKFFGSELARELSVSGKQADLMIANNVLAHVPDINDFVSGFSILLKPNGVATFEFPHLLRLIEQTQFDTIYHEHFSYLSLTAVVNIFSANGLKVFDVEELPTHGGSLRVFAQRQESGAIVVTDSVAELLVQEKDYGLKSSKVYSSFQFCADQVKNEFLSFLIKTKLAGKKIAGYGAAAKGSTLLNYAGVRHDLLPWVADRNPVKQGKYLPGSRIPIVAAELIYEKKPDIVLILPWNIADEIIKQNTYIRKWGGEFFVALPFVHKVGGDME